MERRYLIRKPHEQIFQTDIRSLCFLLKLTGYVHQQVEHFRIDILPPLYLFVLYLSQNKERLMPYIT